MLPYVLDARYPSDTLFIFCEADMRIYERDCFAKQGANWQEAGYESFLDLIRAEAAEKAWAGGRRARGLRSRRDGEPGATARGAREKTGESDSP